LIFGESAPGPFIIRENGLRFEISFAEGYSAGLFLDQRDNRRRVITSHVGAGFSLFGNSGRRSEVLNAFAYTCGFSVCAARAGARVTSLDLSKKYLEWGKRNFALNHLAAAGHDFVYGDVFDWLPRLKKKGRGFDLVLLDPPTFSNSKDFGVFRAEKDYGRLLASALPLVNPSGVVFCSSNAANLAPETFLSIIEKAVRISKRKVIKQRYFPQPPDFPISRSEPAYLKTVWLQLD
jgi:23S rRNA (cytosine1962-C5)-methyltransferase